MARVSLPRKDAEAILRKTMISVGYDKAAAEIGVWSALWLEERSRSGLTWLIVYLALINGKAIDELRPRKHPEFGIAGVCPFMMADAIISVSDAWLTRGKIAFGAPAEPFLMMASIADWASQQGKSVRFQHRNYSCLLSSEGVEIETDNFAGLGMIMVEPDKQGPMMIELTDARPQRMYQKLDVLDLPSARLRGNNALDLT